MWEEGSRAGAKEAIAKGELVFQMREITAHLYAEGNNLVEGSRWIVPTGKRRTTWGSPRVSERTGIWRTGGRRAGLESGRKPWAVRKEARARHRCRHPWRSDGEKTGTFQMTASIFSQKQEATSFANSGGQRWGVGAGEDTKHSSGKWASEFSRQTVGVLGKLSARWGLWSEM